MMALFVENDECSVSNIPATKYFCTCIYIHLHCNPSYYVLAEKYMLGRFKLQDTTTE